MAIGRAGVNYSRVTHAFLPLYFQIGYMPPLSLVSSLAHEDGVVKLIAGGVDVNERCPPVSENTRTFNNPKQQWNFGKWSICNIGG